MRKLIIMIVTLSLTLSFAFAQFTKGTKSAGGTLGWSSTTYDGEAAYSMLTIAPSIGYFAMDNLGVNFGLAMVTFTPEGGDGETNTSFGLGAKYYINSMYAGGSFSSYTAGEADPMSTLLIEAGYLYGLSDAVFLDAGFDYSMGMGDNKQGGMALGVGVVTFF